MKKNATKLRHNVAPQNQRGVVLVIALIVLVAMTLAGIALVRSADTGNVIAGNLAFKQSATQASDRGIEAAYNWLTTQSGTAAINNTNTAAGYYSSIPTVEPDWTSDATWANAVIAPDAAGNQVDAAGNTVSYIIHRMCTQPDTAYNGSNSGVANQCALSSTSGGGSAGSSMSVGAFQPNTPPQIYYRVTSRSSGPRNTYGVTQAMILMNL